TSTEKLGAGSFWKLLFSNKQCLHHCTSDGSLPAKHWALHDSNCFVFTDLAIEFMPQYCLSPPQFPNDVPVSAEPAVIIRLLGFVWISPFCDIGEDHERQEVPYFLIRCFCWNEIEILEQNGRDPLIEISGSVFV